MVNGFDYKPASVTREAKQKEICDLADKILDKALANGEPFSEGLTNWAIGKAEQELGSVSYD